MHFNPSVNNVFSNTIDQLVWVTKYAFATPEFEIPEWAEESDIIKDESIKNNVALKLVDTTVIVPNTLYNVKVAIDTPLTILSQIDHVTYFFHSTFPKKEVKNHNREDFFALSFNGSGLFLLRADITFINGSSIELRKPIEIGSGYILPPDLNVDIKNTTGNTITISGEAISVKNITKIFVQWGDDEEDNLNLTEFNLSHTYDKAARYEIIITVYDNDNLSTTKSILTNDLYLNNFFKDQPFIDFDTKIQATLRIFDMTEFVVEKPNTETPISIRGSLSTLNGSALDNKLISIAILQDNIVKRNYTELTQDNGIFSKEISSTLPPGKYELLVQPIQYPYSQLRLINDFLILKHQLTSEELITYTGSIVGLGVAVIGIVTKIPPYLTSKKQKSVLRQWLIDMNYIYKKYKKDTQQCLENLENLKNSLIQMLYKGKINEDQYEMLDKKVSDYIEKVKIN